MQVLEWLLPTTERFRKRACFTLANRIDQLAIDVIEDLVEARYTCDKLEWLRVLLRRSYVVEQRAALEAAAGEMVLIKTSGLEMGSPSGGSDRAYARNGSNAFGFLRRAPFGIGSSVSAARLEAAIGDPAADIRADPHLRHLTARSDRSCAARHGERR